MRCQTDPMPEMVIENPDGRWVKYFLNLLKQLTARLAGSDGGLDPLENFLNFRPRRHLVIVRLGDRDGSCVICKITLIGRSQIKNVKFSRFGGMPTPRRAATRVALVIISRAGQ